MFSVLFVCLGNICRSPAGEGILLSMAAKRGLGGDVEVESCGTGAWHVGELPDERMRKAALNRGLDLQSRGQQFERNFFDRFDYVLAADRVVFQDLCDLAGVKSKKDKVYLMTHFSKRFKGEDVPDPYFGDGEGFDEVLDMLEESCEGLLDHFIEEKGGN